MLGCLLNYHRQLGTKRSRKLLLTQAGIFVDRLERMKTWDTDELASFMEIVKAKGSSSDLQEEPVWQQVLTQVEAALASSSKDAPR